MVRTKHFFLQKGLTMDDKLQSVHHTQHMRWNWMVTVKCQTTADSISWKDLTALCFPNIVKHAHSRTRKLTTSEQERIISLTNKVWRTLYSGMLFHALWQITQNKFKLLFKKVKFYGLATLNPNLIMKTNHHLTFFWNSVIVFLAFLMSFNIFYWNLQLCKSGGLKSLFYVEWK